MRLAFNQLLKTFQPESSWKMLLKFQKLFLMPLDKFLEDPLAIFQKSWLWHYKLIEKLWQTHFLKLAKAWWWNFWNFASRFKGFLEGIPVSKQERKALVRNYLSNSFFYIPFGIIFTLIALAVLLDTYPFWRKLKNLALKNFFAHYQYVFFRVIFLASGQFIPNKEVYLKMSLAYVDIGDLENALKIAEALKAKFPEEKIAERLIKEIIQAGG